MRTNAKKKSWPPKEGEVRSASGGAKVLVLGGEAANPVVSWPRLACVLVVPEGAERDQETLRVPTSGGHVVIHDNMVKVRLSDMGLDALDKTLDDDAPGEIFEWVKANEEHPDDDDPDDKEAWRQECRRFLGRVGVTFSEEDGPLTLSEEWNPYEEAYRIDVLADDSAALEDYLDAFELRATTEELFQVAGLLESGKSPEEAIAKTIFRGYHPKMAEAMASFLVGDDSKTRKRVKWLAERAVKRVAGN